jgi:hypothetical protein
MGRTTRLTEAGQTAPSEAAMPGNLNPLEGKQTMNRKIATALVIAAATVAGSAFADDITVDTTPFNSTKSRAEVQAELAQYKTAGVNPWSTQYNPIKGFKSTVTRQQVVAEYLASRDEVAALNGEDSGSAYFAQANVRGYNGGTTLAGSPRHTAQ